MLRNLAEYDVLEAGRVAGFPKLVRDGDQRLQGPRESARWQAISGARRRTLDCPIALTAPALVAQRIEHLTTDQKVGGSNPSERATPGPHGQPR